MTAKELIISIKTLFDGKGSSEAQRQLDATGKKAADAGKTAKSGLSSAETGANNFGKAVSGTAQRLELMGKVMRGLGVVGIVGAAISIFETLRDRINQSKDEAEQLAVKTRQANDVKIVEAAINAYGRLKDELAGINQQHERTAELNALAKGGDRSVEDAQSAAAEKEALAAIDPNDPARSQKEAAVRARFERERAVAAAARKKEDIESQRQQLGQQADISEMAAYERASMLQDLRKQQAAAASSSEELAYRSKAARRYKWDVTGGGDVDTPLSNDYAAAAKSASDNAAKLAETADTLAKEIRSLRDDAAFAREKAFLLANEQKAADITMASSDRSGKRTIAEADSSVAAAQYRDRIADATTRAKSLSSAYDTRSDVFRAQADASDPQRSNFGSRDSFMRAKAEDIRLEKAAVGAEKQSAAVNKLLAQLERTPPEKIAALLGGIESQLRAFESSIRNAEQRSRRQ